MRRSKSQNDGEFDEAENLENLKEPYLSGAYIRSFVKQLNSSRTKDSSSMRERENLERERAVSREQDLSGKAPPPHRKQVRRRLQTRKPYQEKMLNMAEARREIVSALKLHRAAMKQASEKRALQESGPDFRPQQLMISTRNPRNIYASSSYTDSDQNFPVNYSTGFSSPYSWSIPSIAPPLNFQENLDFALPTQTLGLNLNLQDFLAAPSSSIYSSSSPSTSSSPPPSVATEEFQVTGAGPTAAAEVAEFGDQNHIGEFKFMKSMEIRAEDGRGEEFVSSPFDEVMEFPAWLNANESCLQHVNDFCGFQDPALPWMDIEEIEGMDGDWLA